MPPIPMPCHAPAARTSLIATCLQRVLLVGCLAVGLGGCGGGSSDGSDTSASGWIESTISCSADSTSSIGDGFVLVNNTWNASAAGTFAWSQCLKQRTQGSARDVGWSWSWPPNGTQIHAYPEVVLGAKPWDAGPGTDARFPRRVSALQRMPVSFEVETTATGDRNLAVSLWFTRNGSAPTVPDWASITTEIMIWTDYTAAMLADDGRTAKIGAITVGGRVFDLYYGANWGADAGNGVTWNYLAYIARQTSSSFSFDARAFIDDAVSRGLVDPTHYLASFELGNEVASGSGTTWLRSLSVGVE